MICWKCQVGLLPCGCLKTTAHSRGICIGNVGGIAPCLPGAWIQTEMVSSSLNSFSWCLPGHHIQQQSGKWVGLEQLLKTPWMGIVPCVPFWSNKLGFLLVHCGSSLLIVLIRHVWSCADNYLLEIFALSYWCAQSPVHSLRSLPVSDEESKRHKGWEMAKLREQVRARLCVWELIQTQATFFFHS